MINLSDHLSVLEFTHSGTAARYGIDNSLPPELEETAVKFAVSCFEPIREIIGGPLKVDSGFRCQALNNVLPGAATHSQHMKANAIDIVPLTMSLLDGFVLIVKSDFNYDQLILEGVSQVNPLGSWIHVSYDTSSNTQRNEILIANFDTGRPIYHVMTKQDALNWCSANKA